MVARTARVRAVCTSNGGTALEATFSQPRLRLDRCNQRSGPHDVDDTREIVSEDVERHLGGHAWQPFHQEVGCSHPRLDPPPRRNASSRPPPKIASRFYHTRRFHTAWTHSGPSAFALGMGVH